MPSRKSELVIAAECFLALAWARFALRVAPQRLLRGMPSDQTRGELADAAAITRVFNRVAARHPLSLHCMHRSLALQRVLARHGIGTSLRIGLGRKPNLFPGHAWLEMGGVVLNDDPEHVARYEPLTVTASALEHAYR